MQGREAFLRKPVFRIALVYDDFGSGKRALDTCQLIVSQLGPGVEVRTNTWKADLLRTAVFYQMAVDDAVEAEIIIVANTRNSELSGEVARWVEDWSGKKRGRHDAILVPVLEFSGENASRSTAAHAFLEHAATLANIDFLPRATLHAAPITPPAPGASERESAPSFFPLDMPSRPFEGYGIND